MPTFRYIVVDGNNRTLEATVDQKDRSTLIDALMRQKLRPVSIKEVDKKNIGLNREINLFKHKKVKREQLAVFTQQLSVMVGAGVPLLRALNALYTNQPANAPLKPILNSVVEDVKAGQPLSQALSKFPKVFDDIYVNMVRAGETAGILDDILKRLATRQENSAYVRKRIISAMSYPMVLIAITIIAFFGLMIFVMPRIGKIIHDLSGGTGTLPPITLAMLAISDFFVKYWFIIIGAIVGISFFLVWYTHTPKGRYNFHSVLVRTPLIKTLVIKLAVANFARTFSALIDAGVAVLEALDVTSHAVGNAVYEKALQDAAEKVKNGQSLSAVIEQDSLFPPIVAQMLSVGEETGQTGKVLVKVADFYEEEVDTAVNSLSSILEPVMIVIMGAVVGLIAASVMLPIAQLSQNVK